MNKKQILIIIGSVIVAIILIIIFILIAYKKPITYSVTFDTNGGTSVDTQIVNKDDTVTKPDDPEKDGYVFDKWTYLGKTYDFSQKVVSDIELVAQWTKLDEDLETFNVKFNTDGGSTITNKIVIKGNKVEKPTNPTKDGYNFVGWTLDDEIYDFDCIVENDIELKAKWEKVKVDNSKSNNTINKNSNNSNNNTNNVTPQKKTFNVTFNSNGGSNVSSQTVGEGSKVSKPSNPTRNGYNFVGWLLNGKTYDFNSAVNGNITLDASWTEIKKNNYIVTFNSNGGSSVSLQNVIEGSKVSKPTDPIRSGYNFAGWLLNGSAYDFNSAVNGNITLVAKWNQKSYKVVANSFDQYTEDRILTVYEDDKKITVQSIKYSDGVHLCSGSNPTVFSGDIVDEKNLLVVLSDGTQVSATLKQ